MFGYIRPLHSELRVREFERFKACYCGLCHALGEKYGLAARFTLSFELVFLAMLLWGQDDAPQIKRRRCFYFACPFGKRAVCMRTAVLDTCAGYNIILTWHKLCDSIADEPFLKTIPHRLGLLFLRSAYKKAARGHPQFDSGAKDALEELSTLEAEVSASLDGAADKFARILTYAADAAQESAQRQLRELLYHMGRWIYIIDACDDYEDDVSKGRYNPAAARFPPESGSLSQEGRERLMMTLRHSNNLIGSAFELLPGNPWTEIVENTVYLGMPNVLSRVFDGTWRRPKRYKFD